MQALSKKKEFLPAVIFFAAYYLYVWLMIEPHLLYYTFGRTNFYHPFLTGRQFLFESLSTVGGPANYLAGFLSACFYFSWLGAFIITVVALLFWFLMIKICRLTKTGGLTWTGYLIPFLILVLYGVYDHQLLDILSFMAVLAAFVFHLKATIRNTFASGVLFLTEFILLYYAAGGIALLFGGMVVLYELLLQGRGLFAAGVIVWLALWCGGMVLLDIPIHISHVRMIHRGFIFGRLQYSIYAIYAVPVLLLLVTGLYRRLFKNKQGSDKCERPGSYIGVILKAIASVLLIAVAFGVFRSNASKLSIEPAYYVENHQWQKALDCIAGMPVERYDILSNYDANRAMYYAGQLGNTMFFYHQNPQALLLPDTSPYPILPRYSRMIDTFLELGYLGESERLASEVMELTRGCPYSIHKLALINLAKKQNDTARIYLCALSKDLVYGRFARELLARLEKDPQLTDYEPVRYLRSVTVETDNAGNYNVDDFFLRPLQKNPRNKMAFEYMMAFYLVTGQVEKVARNIHRLKDFSYEKMPRHYDEALIIYAVSGGGPVDLGDLKPNPETMQQFNNFDKEGSDIYARSGDMEEVRQALERHFGDSFMYYLNFELPKAQR